MTMHSWLILAFLALMNCGFNCYLGWPLGSNNFWHWAARLSSMGILAIVLLTPPGR